MLFTILLYLEVTGSMTDMKISFMTFLITENKKTDKHKKSLDLEGFQTREYGLHVK